MGGFGLMKRNINQQCQVILFVVISMVIALGLGIAVSARTLTSLSRVSDTDTSTRVLAAAEGGAERMLQKSYAELEILKGTCPDYATVIADATSPCIFRYDYTATPPILKSRAVVYIQDLNEPYYRVGAFGPGEVKQVNLTGYGQPTIRMCWSSSPSPAPEANIMYMGLVKSNLANITKGYISSGSAIPAVNGTFPNVTATADSAPIFNEYDQCTTFAVPTSADPSDPIVLRVRPINGDVTKAVFAGVGGDLPSQGYTIVSEGELDQADGKKIKRAVRVTKTFPYAAYSFFDYALYSDQGDVTN
jgi:hypothetical protein